MFVQQKKLTFLNLPATRLRRLFSSTVAVQVVLAGFPAQAASAYLAVLTSGGGIQVLLGFYLVDSRRAIFFLPQGGEVAAERVGSLLQEGLEFAESIGFVMADADIHRLRPDQLEAYWRQLPICRKPDAGAAVADAASVASDQGGAAAIKVDLSPPSISLDERRQRCKESLGRFLASL